MKRALSLSCVTLLVLCAGTALAKPQIAVLGVELQGSDITPQDAQAASELTQGLRSAAKAATGRYQLAPGSDKELIDEKMLKGCDSELPACMASIGGDLNADALIYGNVERKGDKFVVDLKLLNVARKAVEKRWSGAIPVKEATGTPMQGWGKKIYGNLTGQGAGGTLVVKVGNLDRATVLVDGTERGNVVSGKAEITGLAPGSHKVTIQPMSEMYQPLERSVTIGDDTETLSVDLEKKSTTITNPPPHDCDPRVQNCELPPPPPPHHGSSRGMWRGAFYGAVGVGLVAGGVWIYEWRQLESANDNLCSIGAGPPGVSCGAATKPYTDADFKKYNDAGHSADSATHIAGYVTAGAAAIALGTFYMGFLRGGGDDSSEHASNGTHRVHRDKFVVTPVITPDGGGATLRLEW